MDHEKILVRVPKTIIDKLDKDENFIGLNRTAKIIYILNNYYNKEK